MSALLDGRARVGEDDQGGLEPVESCEEVREWTMLANRRYRENVRTLGRTSRSGRRGSRRVRTE